MEQIVAIPLTGLRSAELTCIARKRRLAIVLGNPGVDEYIVELNVKLGEIEGYKADPDSLTSEDEARLVDWCNDTRETFWGLEGK